MQTYSVINKVEKQFPVETIVAENIPIWQFLRNIYADKLNKNHSSERNRIPKNFPRITNKLSNIFWEKQNKKQHYSRLDTEEDWSSRKAINFVFSSESLIASI